MRQDGCERHLRLWRTISLRSLKYSINRKRWWARSPNQFGSDDSDPWHDAWCLKVVVFLFLIHSESLFSKGVASVPHTLNDFMILFVSFHSSYYCFEHLLSRYIHQNPNIRNDIRACDVVDVIRFGVPTHTPPTILHLCSMWILVNPCESLWGLVFATYAISSFERLLKNNLWE